MHVHFGTALVVTALVCAIVLLLERGDRIFPVIAAAAAGLEALIQFDIISLSSGKFRIDVILPALLVIAMGVSWARNSTKSTITAATAGFAAGVIQLAFALRLFE
jgi:uncharacterized membrane protein